MTTLPPRPAQDAAPGRTDAIIDRLHTLYPRLIDLSLDRVLRLLHQLGDPQKKLPPVIHVAGTNGKGSTCAFLRAIAETAGWRAHVTISPHLVHLRERFRLAGELVDDAMLAETLAEIEQVNAGAPITVFEALAAAGYLLFARTPADLCIVEVGLGGRYDATNVVAAPAAAAITSISLDHQEFLGADIEKIAWEKAGIIKRQRPAVTGLQAPGVLDVLRSCAEHAGTRLLARDHDWSIAPVPTGLHYQDEAGSLHLPAPALAGAHQHDNAGIAIAALRASGLNLPATAYAGVANAEWPARLQRLHGRLAAILPPDFGLYLDGGHNEGAAHALANQIAAWRDRPLHLIVGMKQSKNPASFLAPLVPHAATIWAVREPGQHLALPVQAIIDASEGRAQSGPDIASSLGKIAVHQPGRVLICGSLYLAGEALKFDAIT